MEQLLAALKPLSSHLTVILLVYAVMSLVTFIAYGADKKKAQKKQWRTPEATLIGLSFAFGAIGAALGMKFFRHKTKHIKFLVLVPLSLVLHLVFIGLLIAAKFA